MYKYRAMSKFRMSLRQGLIVVVVVAAVGSAAMLISRAATFSAGSEAESGALGGVAAVVQDAAASRGAAVKFGDAPSSGDKMKGLHISGSSILNGAGQQVQMHGVNYSGFEYACLTGDMNDGPIPPTMAQVNGMKSWNINSVRLPLNEDCWLGQHGIAASVAGANYQKAVADFVDLLTRNGLSVIINLHFSGDGQHKAVEQEPMANRPHSNAFWRGVAEKFKGNSAVMFELFNEPHLNDVTVTGGSAWGCWRDGGCTVKGTNSGDGSFTVAGMQEMLTAVRTTGATNIVIVTGQDWGADLSGWAQYRPADPLNQLIAGWHTYGDGLSCGNQACWNTTLTSVLTNVPILATEIGQLPPQQKCAHNYIDQVMNWLDSHNMQGYYAWTWGPFSCGNDPALIADSGWQGTSPTQTYGSGYKAHLLTRP